MHLKKYADFYIGLFFLSFTLIYISQIPTIRITRISLIDSAAYPKVMAALLLSLSVMQLFIALKKLKQGAQVQADQTKREYRGVVLTLLLVMAYVMVVEPLGFPISSAIYIFLHILVMCPPDKVRPGLFALIAVATPGFIYAVFRYGLNLMLPLGVLEGLL